MQRNYVKKSHQNVMIFKLSSLNRNLIFSQKRSFAILHHDEKKIVENKKFGNVRESIIKLKKIINENNCEEEKEKEKLISNFLEYSQGMILLIKSISQESFDISEMKPFYNIEMGISIDGKDILEIDQVTYLNFLRKSYLREFNKENLCSREKLISLMLLAIELIYAKNAEGLRVMAMFVRDYPRVKELYMKLYNGSIDESWTNILGKQYSEDEFDWIEDLETELPINLNGMYNIFNSIIAKQSKDEIIDICNKEIVKSPLNPYIPLIHGVLFNSSESINQALEIMKNSTPSKLSNIHRLEKYNLYNYEKTTQKGISDLKFTPILFWKCHFENSNINLSDWIQQIETHSRFPTHYNLIQLGIISSFENGNYAKVLDFIQLLKYFESQIHPDDLFESLTISIKAARQLDRENELKSFIGILIEKHGENSVFSSLLQNLNETKT